MEEKKDKKYLCNDCGTPVNEGEAKTFGICDECWNRYYNERKLKHKEGKEQKQEFKYSEIVSPFIQTHQSPFIF